MPKIKIDPSSHAKIIKSYTEWLIPMATIAAEYGVTRMTIYKILRKHKTETDRIRAGRRTVTCVQCGKQFSRTRSHIRRVKHQCCNLTCYNKWLKRHDEKNPLMYRRQATRIARKKVSEYMCLHPGTIVHHEDRNEWNNNISNLRVFASQADHLRFHRDFPVKPIWDGRNPEEVPQGYERVANHYIS